MLLKILILFLVLLLFIFIESRILKKRIIPYHSKTWSLVELFWYLISFAAACIGLIELERIEKLNKYKERERILSQDYHNKRSNLHAQVWILKIDSTMQAGEEDGVRWFHKMKRYFDEGVYSTRWEDFLAYSKSYIFREPGVITDNEANAIEFSWPRNSKTSPDSIFLRDEIKVVVDSLNSFKSRKDQLFTIKPEENTNYKIRYYLIFFFLIGLSLKILKIYADYKKTVSKPE